MTSPLAYSSDSGQETGPHSGFSDVTKMMRGSFKYTICSNEESVFLITSLDDLIYNALKTIHRVSPLIRRKYMDLVRNYAFHPVDGRASYSSKGNDSILLASIFWCQNSEDWLDTVRFRVSLFRLYWMDILHELDNASNQYHELLDVDPESDAYITASIKKAEIEKTLMCNSDTVFGVINEIQHAVKRMGHIVRKLTYPYLRKVVTHAKHHGMDKADKFFENYQNGSAGIRIAIGRHDCNLGAFASTVDRWINNRIMTYIRDNGMLVKVPDRAFTHKNIVEKHMSRNPHISLDEIAEKEGIKPKLLTESMMLVQSQTAYVDLQDEDESTSKHSHDYIDRATDPDSSENTVNQMVQEYAGLLKPREQVLLAVAYGIEAPASKHIDIDTLRAERVRQLLTPYHTL
jgi:DNA-directed RNA polymerase sigma subunit (sigma70/sigma32)